MLSFVKSNIDGFLDGYKARNLSTNRLTTDFHIEEMRRLVEILIESLVAVPAEESGINYLKTGKVHLEKSIETSDLREYFDSAYSFGESLKTFVDLKANLNGEQDTILKKIVYHYLNLAIKLEEDERIAKVAKEIASKFDL